MSPAFGLLVTGGEVNGVTKASPPPPIHLSRAHLFVSDPSSRTMEVTYRYIQEQNSHRSKTSTLCLPWGAHEKLYILDGIENKEQRMR
jgi:hypothetical protein